MMIHKDSKDLNEFLEGSYVINQHNIVVFLLHLILDS